MDKGIVDTRELFLKLEPDRETIMDGHLGLALRFYYLAVSAAERRSREEFIMHLSIAAEALVQTGEGKLTENIKRRIAALIGNESDEAKTIAREIGELYRVRGLVVHGHKPKIQLYQTKRMDSYVRRAVQNGLELRHLSKKDLAQWLDQNYRKLTGED